VRLVDKEVRLDCGPVFILLDKGFLECDFDLRLRDDWQKKERGKRYSKGC
jgi:hypothetical protein